MSDVTKIQWCDRTWNPFRGCTKVSAGCAHCYAEELVTRRLGGMWGKGKPRQRAGEHILNAPDRWNKVPWACDACAATLGPSSKKESKVCPLCGGDLHRVRVFLGSLMDIFDEEVEIEWFAHACYKIMKAREIDFLLVTKRPEAFPRRVKAAYDWTKKEQPTFTNDLALWLRGWMEGYPRENAWAITSTEDQRSFDERVPHLLKIPSPVHGLSAEPLLGPIQMDGYLGEWGKTVQGAKGGINWVIVGGESGSQARRCHVEWLRGIQVQCRGAGVPFFCKQLGAQAIQYASAKQQTSVVRVKLKDKKGGDLTEFPADLRVREWPKGGRL
jgi:protein gp37